MKNKPVVRRITVLGCSISLIVRPVGEGHPYPVRLERLLNEHDSDLWLVRNLSAVAATVDDIPGYLASLVGEQPEIIIFHYGHVEAIRRPHSRPMWRWVHLYTPGRSRFSRRVRQLGRFHAALRRRMGWLEQWTPLDRFHRTLDESIRYLREETTANIIIVEANPWNVGIESYGPGSRGEIQRYNESLRRIADAYMVDFIPLSSLSEADVERRSPAAFIPDGTHFNATGHVLLAKVLADHITSRERVREHRDTACASHHRSCCGVVDSQPDCCTARRGIGNE